MLLRSCLIVSSLMMVGGSVDIHAAPSFPHSAESESVHLKRFVLATHVENREPQNVKEGFTTADQQVFAFAEVSTPTSETITFVWSHNDKVHFEWSTHIAASPRFRTYTSVKALPGHWTVKVQDQSGQVLEEKSFEIQDASDHHEDAKGSLEQTHEKPTSPEESTPSPKGVKEALRSLQPTSEDPKTPPQPKEEVKTETEASQQTTPVPPAETSTKEVPQEGK